MSLNINTCQIGGRLTRDPELRSIAGGKEVCTFSMAVNNVYKKDEPPTYFNIEFWGKSATTIADFAKKGSELYVEGNIVEQKWKDKEGNDKSKNLVRGRTFQFAGTRAQSSGESSSAPSESAGASSGNSHDVDIDEVPF